MALLDLKAPEYCLIIKLVLTLSVGYLSHSNATSVQQHVRIILT